MKKIAIVVTCLCCAAAVYAADSATWGQVKAGDGTAPAGKAISNRAGGPIDYVVTMVGNSDPPDFTEVFPEIPEPDYSFLKTLEWSWIQTGTMIGAHGQTVSLGGLQIDVCTAVRGHGILVGNLTGLSAATYYFTPTQMAIAGNQVAFVGVVTGTRIDVGDATYVPGDRILFWIEDGAPDRKLAAWTVDVFRDLHPDADFDTYGVPAGLLAWVAQEGTVLTPYGATSPFTWANGGITLRRF